MAIYTQRGLKIKKHKAYVFALAQRLSPNVDAFKVLQLTEDVENMASFATLLAGVVAFALELAPIMIVVVVGTTRLVFKTAHILGIFIPPINLVLSLTRIYSLLSGYGVFLIGIIAFGFMNVGWQGVVAYVVGWALGAVVGGLMEEVDSVFIKRRVERTFPVHTKQDLEQRLQKLGICGVAPTSSERSFFHAYKILAGRFGVTQSLDVSDEEMEPDNWDDTFTDLAIKWPIVVSRFTQDSVL